MNRIRLVVLVVIGMGLMLRISETYAQREGGFQANALVKADSLFAARQYTQAFDIYSALREQGSWSPAMLLKMAYIQEALGHLGESLYYLNLYAVTSHDPQAAVKMAEVAGKNRLEGYAEDPWEVAYSPLREYFFPLTLLLASLCLLVLTLMVNRSRKGLRPTPVSAVLLLILLAVLYVHVFNSRASTRAIVTGHPTYLMSGPSAGATVVGIIGEGHRLHIKSRHDAWLCVQWKDGEAYVRDYLLRRIEL